MIIVNKKVSNYLILMMKQHPSEILGVLFKVDAKF